MSGLEYWVSYYFGLVQFALPLFVLGVVLLFVGLWGKRSGTEPRCKKCQYNLTGLTSDRCPECGTELSGRTIRTGLRYRRRKCAVMGLLACIATVSPVAVGAYRTAMQIDWYSYCPFSWMLQRAEGADWKAFRELRRRYDAKRLSQSQLHSLMETCLTIQAQGAALPLLRAGINLAYRMGLEGNTTAEQSERFHSQLINPYIEVRPRIQQGSPLPFRLLERNGCPSALAIVTHFDEWPITVGGRLVSAGRERWGSSVTGAGRHLVRSELLPTGGLPPGRYEILYYADLKLICHDWALNSGRVTTLSRPVKLSAQFEVLPVGVPDAVNMIPDPAYAKVLATILRVSTVRRSPAANPDQVRVQVEITCSRKPPTGFAFEVLIKTSEDQLPIGTLSSSSLTGEWGRYARRISATVPAFDDAEVYLILRSSPEVARNTVDIFEIWNGPLTLGPFVVSEPPPPDNIMRGIAGKGDGGVSSAAETEAKVRLEGKTYLVADGDVIQFRFNV